MSNSNLESMPTSACSPALELRGLVVRYGSGSARVEAVRSVDLDVAADEVVAVVGASGSGKSSICRALLGLSNTSGQATASRLLIGGQDLTDVSQHKWNVARGSSVVLVPQHAGRSLVPSVSVGKQLTWYLGEQPLQRYESEFVELGLEAVLDRPGDLPQQFSGGQLHRLVLAMATLGRSPALIVADEPTGSLDASVARTTIELLDTQRSRSGAGMVLVTHDLELAAAIAHKVVVLDSGEVVESGATSEVFSNPSHERTKALLGATSSPTLAVSSGSDVVPVVAGRMLCRSHGTESEVKALGGVSIELHSQRLVAVVGPSGSGKSTLARLLCGADVPTSGSVEVDGQFVEPQELTKLASVIQLVVQDPRGALNPRRSIAHALVQAQRVQGVGRDREDRISRAREVLKAVGLGEEFLARKPRALSGGEIARVAIARALLPEPRALVLDEPTSALDREIQVQVLDALSAIREKREIAIMLVTHDLELALVADHLMVLAAGQVVEEGLAAEVLANPSHQVTKDLLAGRFGASPY